MVPEELPQADASNPDAARSESLLAESPSAPAKEGAVAIPASIASQVIVARMATGEPFAATAEGMPPVSQAKAPVPESPNREGMPPRRRPRFRLPLILFVLTCLSTFWTGASGFDLLATITDPFEVLALALHNAPQGLAYMLAVMGILLAHEMGHYLQAVRYRVPAELPWFIPMPLTPLGTMGAVILMRGSQANRKELFDIGLTGPLAGLLLAFPLAWIGIRTADVLPNGGDGLGGYFGDPLVFKLLTAWLRPDVESASQLVGHANPLVMASWVGMLVTGLNMLPIGQLDGGHVAYALVGKRSHWLARAMVAVAIAFIVYSGQYGWSPMLILVIFLGTSHPPTADDRVALGPWRSALGWISLTIPIFCLTPVPIVPG